MNRDQIFQFQRVCPNSCKILSSQEWFDLVVFSQGFFIAEIRFLSENFSRTKRTVLRQQPDDLLNHAVEYFNNLKVFHRLCFLFLLVISLNIVTGLPRVFSETNFPSIIWHNRINTGQLFVSGNRAHLP